MYKTVIIAKNGTAFSKKSESLYEACRNGLGNDSTIYAEATKISQTRAVAFFCLHDKRIKPCHSATEYERTEIARDWESFSLKSN